MTEIETVLTGRRTFAGNPMPAFIDSMADETDAGR